MQERQETRVQALDREDPLEEEMATHSNILAWRIPGKEEPGGLLSLGSHRVGHDQSDLAATAAVFMISFSFCLSEKPFSLFQF